MLTTTVALSTTKTYMRIELVKTGDSSVSRRTKVRVSINSRVFVRSRNYAFYSFQLLPYPNPIPLIPSSFAAPKDTNRETASW
jgi:hypothetical protein